jgi:hypothetical protein
MRNHGESQLNGSGADCPADGLPIGLASDAGFAEAAAS